MTSAVNGASRKDTVAPTPNPQPGGPIRYHEQSRHVLRPVSPRLMPRNQYPQSPSPPSECMRPVPVPFTHIPLPTFPGWSPQPQVQPAMNSAPMNLQPMTASQPSPQRPSSHHLSPRDYSSNLHQGELAHQTLKCHWLLQTGWQTSSQQVERNQFRAGDPSGRYVEWCSTSRKED
ncbi:hypothetical protein CPB84DRAFT_1790572 [Gymnopilus junonius]|uniref:Uncharacterized protein n=1 Tax=Gymnopilus junonius TaxID=109634 RepID=A0A9P5NF55_GYMJU|nr:hypothetical protein CPB84DRAFT_1790572 [Gymnopilus junonius]